MKITLTIEIHGGVYNVAVIEGDSIESISTDNALGASRWCYEQRPKTKNDTLKELLLTAGMKIRSIHDSEFRK